MAITLKQSSATGSGTGTAVDSGVFPTAGSAGNGIVVQISYGANNLSSVTDNIGNTYSVVRSNNFFGAQDSAIAFCSNPSAGVTKVTAHFSASTTVSLIQAHEVYGQLTSHANNGRGANEINQNAGAITTTTADTIAFICTNTSNTPTLPSGYTNLTNTSSIRYSYKVYTTTQSSITPGWTVGTSSPHGSVIVAFTSTNTTGPSVDVSFSHTLTWTPTHAATGRDMPALADTLTWTPNHAATGRDMPAVADTLTWTGTFTPTGHDAAYADAVTWSGAFTPTGRDVTIADTLTWTDTPSVTGRDDSTADTLTWTDAHTPTGRDTPPVADTLTWAETVTVSVDDVGQTNDTLTWAASHYGLADPDILAVSRIDWSDGFSAELDLHQTLNWSDIFWSPDDLGPRHAVLNDTLTWAYTFAVPIRTADTLGWADGFVVQNPAAGWADTLYWRETTQADINLLAIGRYRR